MITVLLVSQLLVWIVLALLVFAGIALARQVGILFERVAPIGALTAASGPSVGSAAPRLFLEALDGTAITIGGPLPAGTGRLVLFVSSRCPICRKLIPIAVRFGRSERLDVVFAGDGEDDEQRALVARYGIADHPFVNSRELGMTYGVDKLPHALLLDDRGLIVAKGLVNSREQLESLVVSRDSGHVSVQDFLRTRTGGDHQQDMSPSREIDSGRLNV